MEVVAKLWLEGAATSREDREMARWALIMHERAMKAEKAIEEHNRACDAACNWRCENRSCSYRNPDGTYKYGNKNCHDCPRDWSIVTDEPQ